MIVVVADCGGLVVVVADGCGIVVVGVAVGVLVGRGTAATCSNSGRNNSNCSRKRTDAAATVFD